MVGPLSGITLRAPTAADVPALGAVHLASWNEAYRGVCDGGWLSTLTVEQFEEYHRPRVGEGAGAGEPFLVATGTGGVKGVVGFARGGPTRAASPTGDALPAGFGLKDGGGWEAELYAIYVLPRCQGMGVGRRLFEGVASALAGVGRGSMCVWVLSGNAGARRFYERMGGALAGESTVTLGGRAYAQVAYGWGRMPTG